MRGSGQSVSAEDHAARHDFLPISGGMEPSACRAECGAIDEKGKGMPKEMAPAVGLEPTTLALTAPCSTIELRRNL